MSKLHFKIQNSKFKVLHSIFNIPHSIFKWLTATRRRKILSSILAVLIVITSIRFVFNKPKEVAAWLDDNWHNRQKITVTNDSTPRTDYQIAINIDTSTPISSSKMQDDCDDIRVYNNSQNELKTYAVINCNTTSTTIGVIDDLAANETKNYWVYYNNPKANNTEADKSDVFEYYDDFNGTSIDTNLYSYGGGGTVTQNDEISMINDSDAWDQYFTSTTTFTRLAGKTFQARFKQESGAQTMIGWHDSGTGGSYVDLVHGVYFNSATLDAFEDGNNRAGSGSYSATQWYDMRIVLKATGATFYAKSSSSTTWTQVYDSSYSSEATLKLGVAQFQNIYSYTDEWLVYNNGGDGPTVNNGSEEASTSPIAYWKMDEGYFDSYENTISQINQYVDIVTKPFTTTSSGATPSDNSLGLVNWDSDKYPNSSVYLEASIKARGNVRVFLYSENGTQIGGILYDFTSSEQILRLRSSALTLEDNTNYTIRVWNTNSLSTTVYSAKLVIQQSNNSKLNITQTQIELGSVEQATSSSSMELVDKKLYYYDSDKFSPDPNSYLEASLKSFQPTIEQQINIIDQIYTTTSTSAIPTDNSLGLVHWESDNYPDSTVYLEATIKARGNVGVRLYSEAGASIGGIAYDFGGGAEQTLRLRSSALTLTDGTNYTIRVWNTNGLSTSVYSAKLIVKQTNTTKITKTETQIEIGDNQASFTNTSAQALTNPKYYLYDDDLFSPSVESSGDATFSATLKIDSSGDTVYAELYNCGNPCDPSGGNLVASVSHTGNTTWSYKSASNIDADADWDTTNNDEYLVKVYCSDGDTGGCSGNIANAKIHLTQYSADGITDLETIQPQVNTANTDTDDTYSSLNYRTAYNNGLEYSNYTSSFGGATLNFFYEATLKTSTATTTTAYAQLYNLTSSTAISGSEVTTTSNTYTRQRSSDITSNLPAWPSYYTYQNLDSQAKNSASSGETSTLSNSGIVVQISNLSTSGAATVYADLYNRTDGQQVSGSQVSSTSNTWERTRSSSFSLLSDKEYSVRLWSSDATLYNPGHMINAKLILDQTDTEGISAVETINHSVNYASTDTDSTYTDQNYLLYYEPDYDHYLDSGTNESDIFFESTLKTSNGDGSNDAYSQLTIDGSTVISNSETTTGNTVYTRSRSSSIASSLPTSASTLDTQLKNEASSTTTASNSWMIIQNSEVLPSAINDSEQGHPANVSGASWSRECKFELCLQFDGTDDYIVTKDKADLDFELSDSFSLSGWFKSSNTTTATLISKFESTGSDGGYKLYMNSNGTLSFGIDNDNSSFPADAATTTQSYNDNSWHHIVAIKNGTSELSLYIDGVRVARDTSIATSNTLANNDVFTIGMDSDLTNNPWKGFIDEIKVFPYALSEEQIKVDALNASITFNDDKSWITDGLVGYWKMDESSGNASDSSGNGYTLTNNGTATFTSGKFGNGSEHVPASNQHFSTATTINGIKTISFWVNPDSTTNYFINLTSSANIQSAGTISTNGISEPKIYINGQAGTTITANTWQLVTVTTNMAIDADAFYAGRVGDSYFDGTIDEVRLYNRALTPSEVEGIYRWAPGPAAYHALDENTGTTNTYDRSGNGYTGTLTSISSESWVQGKFGSALYLDGSADFIDIGTGPTIVNTVSFWVKPDTTSEHFIDLNGSAYISASSGSLSATGFTDPTYYINGVQTASPTVSSGEWQHIAITTATSLNASDYDIGRLEGTDYLAGVIDDIKLYNYTRTPGQIIEDMNAGHPAPGSPIGSASIEYKFDEGYGTTSYNSGSGGSSLDGTITSGTWTNSGKFGKALTFTASTSVTETISDPGYTNTLSLWVYPTTSAASKTLVTSGKLTTDASSQPVYGGCTGSALSIDTWTHIVAVSDGSGSCSIYQNGVKTASGTTGVTFGTSLNIGGSSFTGTIDEFKLYTLSMTADQVKTEFNQGSASVWGATSTDSTLSASNSDYDKYCVPGDTATCRPPVGEFNLDENTGTSAYDTSTNGLVGTLNGDAKWKPGKLGSAIDLDGTGDYISFGDSSALDTTTDYSIVAWVYPRDVGTSVDGRTIYTNSTGNGASDYGINFRLGGVTVDGQLTLESNDGLTPDYLATTTKPLLTNDWQFVAVTMNDSNDDVIFRIDQVGDNSSDIPENPAYTGATVNVGRLPSDANYFNGMIDMVRVYDYVRTPAQLAWDYNKGGPSFWLKFDECSGSTAYNSSGSTGYNNSTYQRVSLDATINPQSSGNTAVGDCTTSAATMWYNGANGKRNYSLDFDGIDDYVQTSTAHVLLYWINDTYTNLSWGAYVKPGTTPNGDTILGRGSTSNTGQQEFRLSTDTNGNPQCEVMVAAAWQTAALGSSALPTTDWSHLICTYDGANIRLYVNGELDAVQSQTGAITARAVAAQEYIGRYPASATGTYFDGLIDEVKVWNYDLTTTQVKMEYNSGAVNFGY